MVPDLTDKIADHSRFVWRGATYASLSGIFIIMFFILMALEIMVLVSMIFLYKQPLESNNDQIQKILEKTKQFKLGLHWTSMMDSPNGLLGSS